MANRQDPSQVHCYTNPSFCQQSEYIHEDSASQSSDSVDLPPPPQLQDDLPPPPAILQPQPQYGQTNPAFHGSPEANLNIHPQQLPPIHHRSVVNLNRTTADRYCYIDDDVDEPPPPNAHRRVGSLPLGSRQAYAYRTNRYEYIQDDASVQVQVQLQSHHQQQQLQKQQQLQQQLQQPIATVTANNSRYEFIEQQQLQQRAIATPPPQYQQTPPPHMLPSRQNSIRGSVRSYRTPDPQYTTLGPDGVRPHDPAQWVEDDGQGWNTSRRQKSTPRGRYTSVPMQDEDPPCLPERNGLEAAQLQQQQLRPMNNVATQKLHEILTTPRKPRSRSQGDPLSPVKSPQQQQQQQPGVHGLQRGGSFTPGCSPSSSATGHRAMNSPAAHQSTPHQSRALSPRGPTTSTPNKEPPAARRCLPLYEPQQIAQQRRPQHHLGEPPQTVVYGRTTQRYDEGVYAEKQKSSLYQGVEGAFIARTAVVPPLSPPTSEANTTLVSGTEKSSIRNAPIILILVGILTCGLGIYLSWSQGRRYYYDSAIGCGACCTLAGACRSMRRAWTSLSLAFLALLSCCGLLILAAKAPRPGTPLHDVTAGALCGVSLLGAALALLALVAPRCTFGRHRRVHSWIPSFSP